MLQDPHQCLATGESSRLFHPVRKANLRIIANVKFAMPGQLPQVAGAAITSRPIETQQVNALAMTGDGEMIEFGIVASPASPFTR